MATLVAVTLAAEVRCLVGALATILLSNHRSTQASVAVGTHNFWANACPIVIPYMLSSLQVATSTAQAVPQPTGPGEPPFENAQVGVMWEMAASSAVACCASAVTYTAASQP